MSLPFIYIGGNVNYQQCSPIFIKSLITKILFPIIWLVFKYIFFLRIFKPKIISDINKINDFIIEGFFIYRTRDQRRRSYCVLNTNEGRFFVKKGKDVQIETLESSIINSLKINKFNPILPVKTYFLNNSNRLNFYKLHNNNSTTSRLTFAESFKFSNSLNRFDITNEVSLAEYVEKIDIKTPLKVSKKFKILFNLTKSHIIKLGNIHGDLMSNNIIREGNIINILDWESYSHNQPLVIDYIGAADWNIIKEKFINISFEKNSISNFEFDLISFLIITYIRDFQKSKNLINLIINE
jgi:hypothetical protein